MVLAQTRRFHCSLGGALLGVVLISVGLRSWFTISEKDIFPLAYLGSVALVGAGLGAPFRQKAAGAVLACAAFIVCVILVAAVLMLRSGG